MYKWRRFSPVLLLTAAMVLALVLLARGQSREPLDRVRFQEQVQHQTLTPFFQQEENLYYLFLPAYVEPGQVTVSAQSGLQVLLADGSLVTSLGDIPVGERTTITLRQLLTEQTCDIQLQQCRNVTTLFLQLQPGGMERLKEEKENREDSFVQFVDSQGNLLCQDLAQMQGRGNGTWQGQAKRPYNLSFSSPVSLGPFEEVTTLCLMAEYSDESKMRNALAYHTGLQMDIPYASGYLYADVYLNGEYQGLYGICTKQEYEKKIKADGIQAVFELTSSEGGLQFTGEVFGHGFTVNYGNVEAIRQQVSRLEQAMKDQDWETCGELLDLGSFARKYVLDEFIGNLDMGYASQYFYIDGSGKIKSMLPWDYDWSLGSAMTFFNGDHAYSLMTRRFSRYWATRLLDNDAFVREVEQVLREILTEEFLTELQVFARGLDEEIGVSRRCDALRWKYQRPFNPSPYQSGYEDMTDLTGFFCRYFSERRDHLLACFSDPDTYCLVEFRGTFNYYFNYLIPRGESLWDYLRDKEKLTGDHDGYRILGWYAEDGTPLDALDKITADMQLHCDSLELEPAFDLEEEDSTLEKLKQFGPKLGIMAVFGVFALILFGLEVNRILGRKRRKA